MYGSLFILTVCCLASGHGVNILYASEMPSPSHKIFNFALAEALAKVGHNVTFLSPPNFKDLGRGLKNYHPIYLEGMTEFGDLDPKNFATGSILSGLLVHFEYNICGCKHAVQSGAIDTILNYPKDFKFDLIIFDNTNTNCLLPFIQRFNYPPAITVTAFLLPHHMSLEFGTDVQPAYLPNYVVRLPSDMNFFQRVYNYVWLQVDLMIRYFYMIPQVKRLVRGKFGHDMQSLEVLEDHISLVLCNLDPIYHYSRPLPPNVIPVGGMHVKPAKKLPQDLQQIADNATDGIILFALGSNIRSDKFRPTEIRAVLKAFSKIKQTVIWKFESNLTGYSVPENVHTRQWLPQSDILGHPNTKLFITHGGALSTLEAAYFGVPVIGIPFIVDQFINVLMIEERKYGLSLKYEDITEHTFLMKINQILNSPSYYDRMKKVSNRMRGLPQTPMERALFWIDYVMEHNGTEFLNTRARKMSLFESSSTDVKLFLVLVLISSTLVVQKIVRMLRRNNKKDKKQKIN